MNKSKQRAFENILRDSRTTYRDQWNLKPTKMYNCVSAEISLRWSNGICLQGSSHTQAASQISRCRGIFPRHKESSQWSVAPHEPFKDRWADSSRFRTRTWKYVMHQTLLTSRDRSDTLLRTKDRSDAQCSIDNKAWNASWYLMRAFRGGLSLIRGDPKQRLTFIFEMISRLSYPGTFLLVKSITFYI